MGESELETQLPSETISPLEFLDKLCAYAMSIGMSYNDYWYGEPSMLKYYIKAEELKNVRKSQEYWLQGLYTYIAIGSLVPVLNPFSKEHRAKPYLKQPIPITKEEVAQQEKAKYQRFVDYMMSKVKKTEVEKK